MTIIHSLEQLLADNLSESKHLSWGSTAYACFIEKDFIVHDQLLKLPSLKVSVLKFLVKWWKISNCICNVRLG